MADPLFLLDSNICIYLLGGLSLEAKARVEAREPGELVTSAIAFGEVMIGAQKRAAAAQARALFERVAVMPFDEAAAQIYGGLPFKRARLDRLIAAHAMSLGLTLVTNNERDFADIEGLRVENWTLA